MSEAGAPQKRRKADPPQPAPHDGPPIPGLAARKCAARLLAAVVDAHTSLDGLTDHQHGHPQFRALDMRDRALVRAILATALRHRMTITALLAGRLDRPLPSKAQALGHLLHVAAAQILFLDVPDSAAVDLAVRHAKSDPRTARFAGLVNGLLRGLARDKTGALPAALTAAREAPDWFVERLRQAYGLERSEAILRMHRSEAPVDFTVRGDAAGWAAAFGGIVLQTGSVRVGRLPAGGVPALPGFDDGKWWVQDAAAALPARLFGDIAGRSVADLCAAPGGKTAQLAAAGARVTALDMAPNRLERLSANLERLGLAATVVAADALKYSPPAPFDAVLLDAPCSSTGTVRRHPDVPWTKSPDDVARLAGLQLRLLEAAASMVRVGGLVVFANCSLLPEEGEALVDDFLAARADLVLDPILPDEIPGIAGFLDPSGRLRTTPADLDLGDPAISGLDGFFAARFRRLR